MFPLNFDVRKPGNFLTLVIIVFTKTSAYETFFLLFFDRRCFVHYLFGWGDRA